MYEAKTLITIKYAVYNVLDIENTRQGPFVTPTT